VSNKSSYQSKSRHLFICRDNIKENVTLYFNTSSCKHIEEIGVKLQAGLNTASYFVSASQRAKVNYYPYKLSFVQSPEQCATTLIYITKHFVPFWPSSCNIFAHSRFYFTAISPYTAQHVTHGSGCILLLHNNPIYIIYKLVC
jgi:hypothetical protein